MRLAIVLWAVSLLPLAAQQPVKITDLLNLRQVTAVDVSPDGAFAVYAVQSVHSEAPADGKGEPKYSYRTHLYRIGLNDRNAKPEQLTFGARRDGAPVISPDGKWLAFVRAENTEGKPKPQVWVMPLGGAGEARAATKLKNGAGPPKWRRDSKALYCSSAIPLSEMEGAPPFDAERPRRAWFDFDRKFLVDGKEPRPDGDLNELRHWLERNASKRDPVLISRLAFQDEQGLREEMSFTQLFAIELEHGDQSTQLTKTFRPHNGFEVSPDGGLIAFSAPPPDVHPDRTFRQAIYLVDPSGANERVLLNDPKLAYATPLFTSDGKRLVFSATETDEPAFRQSAYATTDLNGGNFRWLTKEWDSDVRNGQIMSTGALLFASDWHGATPLESAELASGAHEMLTKGPVGAGVFAEGGGRIVTSLISVPNPNELYVIEKGGSTRQLTRLNTDWIAQREISLPAEHWLTRPDGTKVQYWVMPPLRATGGRRAPFVLDIHGGPTAMWGPGEFTMWLEFQLFNAWGYGVIYANPRGSGGYGYKHQRGNYQDWGAGPSGDVLAAVDEQLKLNPLIDRDRLFLTGGSYGGYLTAWIVGHDQRFKAAAAQRGVYDLTTFFGEGNAFRLVERWFGGFPWQPEVRKILDRESPYTYVDQIKTPLLILHASEDLRTGVTQSEMLYKSLKQMGRPVEYVRYPGTGHELTRSGPPLQRMDHMMRIIEFFERYKSAQ